MAKKPSALAGIFEDVLETPISVPVPQPNAEQLQHSDPHQSRRSVDTNRSVGPARRSSHPGKKPVLIHIPEDMHRTLRQLSVEADGEPLTVITERLLRQYLVKRGHTRFAP